MLSFFFYIIYKPICEHPFTIEFENDELPKEELKRLIFNETLYLKDRRLKDDPIS
jgi:hypothetical protein